MLNHNNQKTEPTSHFQTEIQWTSHHWSSISTKRHVEHQWTDVNVWMWGFDTSFMQNQTHLPRPAMVVAVYMPINTHSHMHRKVRTHNKPVMTLDKHILTFLKALWQVDKWNKPLKMSLQASIVLEMLPSNMDGVKLDSLTVGINGRSIYHNDHTVQPNTSDWSSFN